MFKSLFNPSLASQMSTLVLSTLLIRITLCLAVISCFDEAIRTPSDCRHILAHWPLTHVPDSSGLADAHAILNPSSPFSPSAQFLHGSCAISTFLFNSTNSLLPIILTQTSALTAWTLIRQVAISIVEQCVENQQSSVEQVGVGATGISALVGVRPSDMSYENQRLAMEHHRPPDWDIRYRLFWRSYYHV